jgi:predicted MFS family arabinose efflux permease
MNETNALTALGSDGASRTGRRPSRSGLLLVLLCAVQFLDGMDVSAMGTALPKIENDLGMTPDALQWVVSAYVLGYGGFLLLGGRLADLFPRRRLLVGSLLTFTVASWVGGVAGEGWVLVAARLALGVSAAFSAPTALAVLLDTYRDDAARNRALGAFTATGAAGFVLGLVLGGALAAVSWRLTLLVPGVVALIVALAASRLVPTSAQRDRRDRVDLRGALTVTSAVLLVVYGVTGASTEGWTAPVTALSLAAALVLVAAFVLIERSTETPLIPLAIFRRLDVTHANLCALLFQGAYVAFQFVATLYYQDELGWSPFQAGLAFLWGGVIVVFASPRFAAVVTRTGAWPLVAVGMGLQAVSYLWFVVVFNAVDPVALVLVQQTLGGIGWAATYTALNIAAVSQADEHEQGLVSAMFIAAIQIGSGVVLAVVASVFAASSGAGFGAYRAGGWTVVAVSTATTVLATVGIVRNRLRVATA